jgi:hypothetical protein
MFLKKILNLKNILLKKQCFLYMLCRICKKNGVFFTYHVAYVKKIAFSLHIYFSSGKDSLMVFAPTYCISCFILKHLDIFHIVLLLYVINGWRASYVHPNSAMLNCAFANCCVQNPCNFPF